MGGFCPSPSSTRTPSAARALFAVEFPLYSCHGQAPISIDALHRPACCNKFSTFFLLSLELCSFFVPGDLQKRFNLLAIVFWSRNSLVGCTHRKAHIFFLRLTCSHESRSGRKIFRRVSEAPFRFGILAANIFCVWTLDVETSCFQEFIRNGSFQYLHQQDGRSDQWGYDDIAHLVDVRRRSRTESDRKSSTKSGRKSQDITRAGGFTSNLCYANRSSNSSPWISARACWCHTAIHYLDHPSSVSKHRVEFQWY